MIDTEASPRRAHRAEALSKGDLRERDLLDAASRLLASGAFGAASITEIAQEAGLSRASFYFYFASKQALLASLLDSAVSQFNGQIASVVDGPPVGSPADVVRSTVQAAAELWWEHGVVLSASVELGTAMPEVYERTMANFARRRSTDGRTPPPVRHGGRGDGRRRGRRTGLGTHADVRAQLLPPDAQQPHDCPEKRAHGHSSTNLAALVRARRLSERRIMPALHVLIAGGGLGGLALAQGLRAHGHEVDVFERDDDMNRRQGYYLTINGDGGEALRQVLAPDLFELYLDTARQPYPTQASIVLDTSLTRLGARPSMGPPNLGERRHTGVDRRTLRTILAARLEGAIHWGEAAVRYDEDADGVSLELASGRVVRGDILVIADGIRSELRDQRLPATRVVSTSIKGIDLYARAPYTPALLELIPDELHDSMNIVADGKGNRALLGSFRPRTPIREAAAHVADVDLPDIGPYMMVSCSVPPTTVIPPASEWTDQTRADIKAGMQQTVDGWAPAVEAIVDGIDPSTIFSIAFSYLEPQTDWEPSRVTVLGDAAHGMLPTVGMGANSALRDAGALSEALQSVGDDLESIRNAIGTYEEAMRRFAYPIIRIAADHDNVFGGGALTRSEAGR